ncbi:MAG: O-antigen ligase family protein [Elusimicrobia bacterium]|nr:O-antigen ligase family protein [Elusimicrobiota bacterium]
MLRASTLLLALLPLGFLAGGLRSPWMAAVWGAWVWLIALKVREASLRREFALWALWLAWAGVAQVTSSQPLKGLQPLAVWLGVTAFFVLAGGLWRDAERRAWLWLLTAGALALMAGSVLIWNSSLPWTGLMPPYYNYNAFVLAAAIGAGAAALGHEGGPRGRPRLVLASTVALAVVWLVAARSRGGLFAAAVATTLAVWRQGRVRLLVYGWVALLAAAASLPLGAWERVLKLDKAATFKRPEIWAAAVQVAGEHPWLGVGPGNFEQGFMRHNFPSRGAATNYGFAADRAHSEPLTVAAETGWMGLVFFLGGVAALLRRPSPTRCADPPARSLDAVSEAGLMAFAAMSAHLLVDNMLHLPALAMLYFSAIVVARPGPAGPGAERLRRLAPSTHTRLPAGEASSYSPRLWRAVCVGGLALSLAAPLPKYFAARYQSRAWDRHDLAAAKKAVAIYPMDDHLRGMLARLHLRSKPPDYRAALRELEAASILNPTSALHPVMAAEIQLLRGRPAMALPLLQEAIRLEPNFFAARMLRAEVWSKTGRARMARWELGETLRRSALIDIAAVSTRYSVFVLSFDAQRFDALSKQVGSRPPKGPASPGRGAVEAGGRASRPP